MALSPGSFRRDLAALFSGQEHLVAADDNLGSDVGGEGYWT